MLITHDLGVIAETCDRVYVMYAGSVLEYGDVTTLFDKRLHPYTAALLESALSIEKVLCEKPEILQLSQTD